MKWTLLIFGFAGLLVSSCQGTPKETKADSPKETLDQLYDDVMTIHDKAMARMGELHQVKRSINEVLEAADTTAVPMDSLKAMIENIELADEGMFEWMGSFRDPRESDPTAAEKYLLAEMEKVKTVDRLIDEAITNGRELAEKYK